jgi:hypothetical protein
MTNLTETIPTETAQSQSRRISSCTGCQLALPLRLTRPGEMPIAWSCAACGAPFSAVLDETASSSLHHNVRVSDKLFSKCRGQTLPQGMANFLAELAQNDEHHDRRQQKRFKMAIRATAIPVNERLSPLDEAFTAMTINISQSGLALIHTRAVNCRFLLIELEDKHRTQVVLEVIRSRHVGRFYDIAGRFVTRLGTVKE